MQSETEIQNEGPVESAAPAEATVTNTEAPASGEPTKQSMLDAVLEVVKQPTSQDGEEVLQDGEKAEDVPPSEEAEKEDQAEETGKASEDETDDTEDEPKAEWTAEARKKVNKLLRQRRELKNEVQTLRPTAEIGDQLQTFANQHDLSSDDVVNALHIAATLRRGDYKSFYEMVAPFVRHAQEFLGVVLPDDLQQMVYQQQISEQAAREFARTRIDQQRVQIENQRMNEIGRQIFVQQAQGDVGRAVTDYEAQLAARDPDYKAISGVMQRIAGDILRSRGGQISNSQEALDIVKAAYDEAKSYYRKMAPPPRATARNPAGANQQTTSARIAPRSLLEAVQAGIARSNAR